MTETSGIDKLTPKQQAFVEAYLESGSAAEAYRRAYSCANMAVATIQREATRLLANPAIDHTITTLRAQAANEAALSRAWVLTRLMKNAEVALGERTIKLRVQRKDKESGTVDVGEIEITDRDAQAANRALELLGKTDECRLFIDRLEATGKDGAPLLEQPANRDIARAVLDILRTAKLEKQEPDQNNVEDESDEPDEAANYPADEDEAPPATAASIAPVADARAVKPAPVRPRPRPTKLQPGEREVLDNGAQITYSSEFGRYACHDGLNRLAGWRKDLVSARALAETLTPPPPDEGRRNGRS